MLPARDHTTSQIMNPGGLVAESVPLPVFSFALSEDNLGAKKYNTPLYV